MIMHLMKQGSFWHHLMYLNGIFSCVLISFELTELVVALSADGKNLFLADGGVWHGNDGADFLCVLLNLYFNYV